MSTHTPHVTDDARRPAHPPQKRTEAKELHPFNNIIVKTTLAQVGLTYDPLLYPGTACQSWCGGEILIDVEASEARDRQHYPENNIADWTEKCSWDGLCAGCAECAVENNQGTTCVPFCEILTSDSLTAPWKKQTLSWNTTCAWGPCHGCDECMRAGTEERERVEELCDTIATTVQEVAIENGLSLKASYIAYESACAAVADGASLQQAAVVYTAASASANAGELAGFNDADMSASGHAAGGATWTAWRELQQRPTQLAPALAGGKESADEALRGMPTENAIKGGKACAEAVAGGKQVQEAKQIGQQAAVGPESGKVPPLKPKGGGGKSVDS